MWKCGILGPCSGQSLDSVPAVHLRLEAEGPKEAGLGDGMWGGRESPSLVPHISPMGRQLYGAQACGCLPDLDPGAGKCQEGLKEAEVAGGLPGADPSRGWQGLVGGLLTEYSEDGR